MPYSLISGMYWHDLPVYMVLACLAVCECDCLAYPAQYVCVSGLSLALCDNVSGLTKWFV